MTENSGETILRVDGLAVGYGDEPVLLDVNFAVRRAESLAILGPSGCGKTTLLRTLIGLQRPLRGRICLAGEEIGADAEPGRVARVHRHFGVLFQSDALLGSLSIAENIALPLEEFTRLPREIIEEMVRLKLELVQLGPFAHQRPSQLSGGMRKRAGLARAMALDPDILFCDEPTSGLDPPTAREVDRLLLELRKAMRVTLIIVSHELASVENIADHCILLDREAQGIIARGSVDDLRSSRDPRVTSFFQRDLAENGR